MRNRILLVTPIYIMVALLVLTSRAANSFAATQNLMNAQSELQLAKSLNYISKNQKYSGDPIEITISRLGIKLSVAPGNYDVASQTWTLSDNKVHHATQTAGLSNKGAVGVTLIYGHNTNTVLAYTENIGPGDIMEVKTDTGYVFIYRYGSDEIVEPTNTSILDYKGKHKVVLMSCTGTWNENRRVMNFHLEAVRK